MKRLLTLTTFLIVIQLAGAQSFELGGEVGYGKSVSGEKLEFLYLFGNSSVNNLRAGIDFSIKPDNTVLVFNTGILFQRKGDAGPSLNYFKIPAGITVEPGRRVRFIIGGGLFVSYLFMKSPSIQENGTSFSDFQLGGFLNTGIKYYISKLSCLYLQFQTDFDLTTLYRDPIPNHAGSDIYSNMRSYDYAIILGFRYSITKNKSKQTKPQP
jgi:hypothetical protein